MRIKNSLHNFIQLLRTPPVKNDFLGKTLQDQASEMTFLREQLKEEIGNALNSIYYPGPLDGNLDETVEDWVLYANPKWISMLFDLLQSDEPLDEKLENAQSTYIKLWNYTIVALLKAWIRESPNNVIPEVGRRLSDIKLRETALEIMGDTTSDERLVWLQPLIPYISTLSNMETMYLIEAIGTKINEPSGKLLEEIRAFLPEDKIPYIDSVINDNSDK